MKIEKFRQEASSPLHHFLRFVDSVKNQRLPIYHSINIKEEDYDSSCGIIFECKDGESVGFNFYPDGTLRTIIFDSEVTIEEKRGLINTTRTIFKRRKPKVIETE